jgi:dihydrofolate reductase
MPLIQAVVIADSNNGIGKNNRLLAHMPADLRHFKALTTGFPVIMGRKTFDSIKKPLPGRRNIIVTRQDIRIEHAETAHSIGEAIARCTNAPTVSIVGGATIYEQALPFTDVIELTRIHDEFEADTFFPPIDPEVWKEVARENFPADERNPYPFSFITLRRG